MNSKNWEVKFDVNDYILLMIFVSAYLKIFIKIYFEDDIYGFNEYI